MSDDLMQTNLFPSENTENSVKKFRSYLSSPFIAAALPQKDVKKNVFKRKYNNIELNLTSDTKVPFGKNGRLLLSILTTHAVLGKSSGPEDQIVIKYNSLQQLLDELQLPKQRGKEIKEQLECFSGATFVFREKIVKNLQNVLFKDLIKDDEFNGENVTATWNSSGVIPFFDGFQYVDLENSEQEKRTIGITIILSKSFRKLSQEHAVPIDYTVYKNITSVVGKDLYAWFVYRNNSLQEGEPIHISRKSLVDQFLPVKEDSYESEERVNWNTIKEQIKNIKEKYYPKLKVTIDKNNDGITLYKSEPAINENDKRYMLVSSTL